MLPRLTTVCLLAFAPPAHAVEIRVASFNVGALYTDGSPQFGLGDPGTPDFETVRQILGRIDADVVALQEIHNVDLEPQPPEVRGDVQQLAADLGYSHLYIPSRTSLDFTFRVVFLSRYPFITATSIGPPGNANDITRRHPAVRVDVPGTPNDPLIISGHLKSGTTLADRFRRAVEMRRLMDFLDSNSITADDNFVILGDFNLSSTNRTFTELPTGLPSSFSLGSDIAFPITYSTNPVSYFPTVVPARVDLRQLNGSSGTFNSGSTLDIMMVSPAIAGRPLRSEIYNSALDTSNAAGLPKSGSPLAAATSATASDHYAVFADLDLDLDYPNLALAISPSFVVESGDANLTISLPDPASSAVTVTLGSDTPGIAFTSSSTVIIPAGSQAATAAIHTRRNFINDEGAAVTFSAAADGYDPASAVLHVADADGGYTFTSACQTLVENFSGFTGSHDPAPWFTSGETPWRGPDTGSLAAPGFRAYGAPADPSLGFLHEGSAADAIATYTNLSPSPITALSIAVTAGQWKAVNGGSADRIDAELLIGGVPHPLPGLTFTSATHLPTGPVVGGSPTELQTTVTDLSIPPGQNFGLRFIFTPGPGGETLSSDLFINEIHYDNTGTDTGEFVEIVVAPGYTGSLGDISLILYNGTGGGSYGSTHALSTFTAGDVAPSGHRIFFKEISGLQNGPADGFALVKNTQVLQFLSYEGSFAATNGPAAGMTSTDIGVAQEPTPAAGVGSLGLAGSGGGAADFIWTKFTGPHTPGQPNAGQTFSSAPLPQGISFDDVRVTFLDPEDDGTDSDGDGFSDHIENTLTLTDPHDPLSRFSATLSTSSGGVLRLSFPTLPQRTYVIETSTDLETWENGPAISGTGEPAAIDLPPDPARPRAFHRVRIAFQ